MSSHMNDTGVNNEESDREIMNNGCYQPIVDIPNPATNVDGKREEEVWRVGIRDGSSILCSSRLPHGEYASFRCGRPYNFPSTVNLLLWGGLSAYWQELDKKRNHEVNTVALIVFTPLLFSLYILPLVPLNPDSYWYDVISWINALVPLLLWIFIFYVIYVVDYRYNQAMNKIVTEKLGPVYRSYAHCQLRYESGRHCYTSYAYFSITKLSEEEILSISDSPFPSLDDETIGLPEENHRINHPIYNMAVPVFGVSHYNRSLEIDARPKELKGHVNMFVWGAIMECFQKVEKSYRERQRRKMLQLQAGSFFLFFMFAMVLFAGTDTFYIAGILFFIFWFYPVCYLFALWLEPYPSADVLHREYASVLTEVAPIVEQNSMCRVEYVVSNNGHSALIMFSLKDGDSGGVV